MRIIGICCALALAGGLLAASRAEEGGPPDVSGVKMILAAAKKKPVAKRKKVVKPTGPPAKELFGTARTPAPLQARAIGFYAKGCLAGATALPVDGEGWQAMRLSRNRNWGHPELVALVKKLATQARKHDGWPGLLVGDLSQPRGGPMLTGHASHQVGLDADIWLTPMPDRRLTSQEREDLAATSMLAEDKISVDPRVWTDKHARLIKRAASYAKVERIFVHPAIKKALCESTPQGADRAWLRKVQSYWGHHYHFHVRIACPKSSAGCEAQPPRPDNDGCGKELTDWLARVKPKPPAPVPPTATPPKPAKPKPALTLDQLPAECRAVLSSGSNPPPVATAPAAPPVPAKQATTKKPTATK